MAKPLISRKRVEVAIAVAFVAAYIAVPFLVLPGVCSKPKQMASPAAYSFVIDGQQYQAGSTGQHKQTVPAPVPTVTGEIKANGSAQPVNQPLKANNEWGLKFWCEINASDFAVGLFTLLLGIATYFLWRETERLAGGADDQADKMERSIREAAKAATAMQGVADAMATNVERLKESIGIQREIADRQKLVSEMQLRSYLSVVIGAALYQERDKNIRFEAKPMLLNQSPTPARNVLHRTYAGIFPVPLPKGFKFPHYEMEAGGENTIGPQQNRSMSGIVPDYVDEKDVPSIKQGKDRGLYVWGTITYDDAFNNPRETTFCHLITWLPDGKIWGYYIKGRNTAT